MKAANPRPRRSSQGKDGMTAKRNDNAATSICVHSSGANEGPAISPQFSVVPKTESPDLQGKSVEQTVLSSPLSVRAENVLKILALELTDENPPQGRWIASDLLLQRLTYRHLSTARNCGLKPPQKSSGGRNREEKFSSVRSAPAIRYPQCGMIQFRSFQRANSRRPKSQKRWRTRRAEGILEFR